MIVGYARVSTDGQSLLAQVEELKGAGCERIFQEKISGARFDRPELTKLLSKLRSGDTFVVCRLDRLARNSRDLLNSLHDLSSRGISFKCVRDTFANTDTAQGRLMVTILSALADWERSLIIARTSEGRARAMREGVKFGRKPSLNAHQRREALLRRAAGESQVSIARSYAVSHSTISRLKD
jgi:DNA invertase Pin-like site-specific DNA recombinase